MATSGTATLPPAGLLVEANDIVVEYHQVRALRGVRLRVAPGASLAIVGPSGSGKSTLLHTLASLQPPTSGHVQLDGSDLYARDAAALAAVRRQRFGFVFQNHLLINDLPVEENVALPLMLDGVSRREAVRRARAVLAQLDIGELGSRLPGAVSGGQAQRAAIARALVGEPDVVFADEPTGALDSANAHLVLAALLAGVRERGAALVLVTHDQAIARQCAETVRLVDGVVATEAA